MEGNSIDSDQLDGLSLRFGKRLGLVMSSILDGAPTEQGGNVVGFVSLVVH